MFLLLFVDIFHLPEGVIIDDVLKQENKIN